MKNMMAVVLAGLLAVSTAASVPPAISESLPTGSSSEMSINESSAPESDSVQEPAETTSAQNAQETVNNSEAVEGMPSDSQTGTESAPPEQPVAPEVERSEVPTDNAGEEATADSSEAQEAESAEAEEAEDPHEEIIARFEEALCHNLADEQAGSLMGHYGLERSTACTTVAATLVLADYEVSDDLDRNYAMVWAALQNAVEALAVDGHTVANCTYAEGTLTLWV